jgi:hydrogenase/urease accessory protein HupE
MRRPRRRSWRAGIVAALAVLLACLGAASGSAHQVNLSTARIVINDDATVDVEVAMKGSDVDRVVGTHLFDEHTGLVRPDALAAASAAVAAYVTTHAVVLGANGTACGAGPSTVTPDQDGVVARTRWACAEMGGAAHYRSTVLLAVAPDARQVVLIGAGEHAAQDLLDADRTEITLAAGASPGLGAVVVRYVFAGMQHIFIGYDHICFLIAIIIWARKLWPVVKIVTAFTIAHSITLSLAALDIVRIPSAITEPAIAATIIFVAVENFFSHDVRNRWRDTFGFGLIHGFGFASALQEFGLPRSALVPALASFNIGVEIGQVVIVSIALPLLLLVDRAFGEQRRPAAVAYGLSGVIVILAGYWFLDRTVLSA